MRDLNIAYRNARHLQTLINDVLDLARLESAQMSAIPEETDPADLLNEAVNTARSLVELRGLELSVEIGPDLPGLWIDATRMRQVLFNVLNNAVRFTESGVITTSVHKVDTDVVFSVKDTGVGIAAKDLPRLFREFEQLDGSMRRRHGGAGLGLAISRRFVELHGGHIWVESEAGVGSSFSFSIPISRRPVHVETVPSIAGAESAGPLAEPVMLVLTRSPSAATLLSRHVERCRTLVV